MASGGIGLNAALAMGAKSLSNQRIGIEVTGRNIANVNTAGASRQRVDLSADISINYTYGQQGTGSYVQGIQALRSKVIDASVVRESSLDGYYNTMQDQTTLAQSALGENLTTSSATAAASSTSGIQLAMNDYFDAWQALSTSPTSQAYRQQVLAKGQTLATDLNTSNQRLISQRDDVATDAASVTSTVNSISDAIANLNIQIVRSEANGGTANDLRDQRQLQLQNLGELVNINVDSTTNSNGTLIVTLASTSGAGLVTLVNGGASGSTATTQALGTNYDPTTNPPLTITYTGSSGTSTIADSVAQTITGVLGADVNVANEVIGSESNATGGGAGMLGQLDTLASNIVSIINTQHKLGYDNEATPQTNIDFFTAGNTRAANISVASGIAADVNTIAASNNTGRLNGSNATLLANMRTDASLLPAYQSIVAGIGQQVQQADQQAASQKVVSDSVKTQQNSVSGISLDEETTNLQMYQRAYEASARFISVIDQMLSRVINGMGT